MLKVDKAELAPSDRRYLPLVCVPVKAVMAEAAVPDAVPPRAIASVPAPASPISRVERVAFAPSDRRYLPLVCVPVKAVIPAEAVLCPVPPYSIPSAFDRLRVAIVVVPERVGPDANTTEPVPVVEVHEGAADTAPVPV